MGDSSAFASQDRSKHPPNRRKTPEAEYLDIGWSEGTLKDGRPYRSECWAQDQMTCLTFFLSAEGLEDAAGEQLHAILEAQPLIRFTGTKVYSGPAMKVMDGAGNEMWSINFVIGDEAHVYVRDVGRA
jgi:hypothetical protein